MSDGNAVMERFIVDQLAEHYELNGFVTPANDPSDFYLYSIQRLCLSAKLRPVLSFLKIGSLKTKSWRCCRTVRVLSMRTDLCNLLPSNETTYLLNLTDDYDYELGSQGYFNKEESGRYVHLKYWERITPIQSFKGGMSSLIEIKTLTYH